MHRREALDLPLHRAGLADEPLAQAHHSRRRITWERRILRPRMRQGALQEGNEVRLRDAATGRRLATFSATDQGTANFPAFTADGSRLALVDEQGQAILIWDLRPIRSELAALGLDWGEGTPALAPIEPPPDSPPSALRVEVLSGPSSPTPAGVT